MQIALFLLLLLCFALAWAQSCPYYSEPQRVTQYAPLTNVTVAPIFNATGLYIFRKNQIFGKNMIRTIMAHAADPTYSVQDFGRDPLSCGTTATQIGDKFVRLAGTYFTNSNCVVTRSAVVDNCETIDFVQFVPLNVITTSGDIKWENLGNGWFNYTIPFQNYQVGPIGLPNNNLEFRASLELITLLIRFTDEKNASSAYQFVSSSQYTDPFALQARLISKVNSHPQNVLDGTAVMPGTSDVLKFALKSVQRIPELGSTTLLFASDIAVPLNSPPVKGVLSTANTMCTVTQTSNCASSSTDNIALAYEYLASQPNPSEKDVTLDTELFCVNNPDAFDFAKPCSNQLISTDTVWVLAKFAYMATQFKPRRASLTLFNGNTKLTWNAGELTIFEKGNYPSIIPPLVRNDPHAAVLFRITAASERFTRFRDFTGIIQVDVELEPIASASANDNTDRFSRSMTVYSLHPTEAAPKNDNAVLPWYAWLAIAGSSVLLVAVFVAIVVGSVYIWKKHNKVPYTKF